MGQKRQRKKSSLPRHKRFNRPQRLQVAPTWLASYTGRNVVKGYRKHFAVDWSCAFQELQLLGLEIDPAYQQQVLQSVAANKRRKAQKETPWASEIESDQDENFAYIAGYTSGGFLYGITWEEMDAINEEEEPMDEQIREILQNIPEGWTVAEEGMAPSVQQEYVEYTHHRAFDPSAAEDLEERSQSLFAPDTPPEEKKETLALLAHQGTVEAYRTLEQYVATAKLELRDWGISALQECRMFLEGWLRDQEGGMVMTGLGGEGNKLRYFFLVRSRDEAAFTPGQKTVLEQAFTSVCGRLEAVPEEIQVHQNYAAVTVLVPLEVAIGEVIEEGINESNAGNPFLDIHYFVTNQRIPTEEEMACYLRMLGPEEA